MSGRRGASQAQRRPKQRAPARADGHPHHIFVGEYDADGVFFYQAYSAAIADFAVANQRLGGPAFNVERMTWIKPSFAWMLYRAGYGSKHGQERVLKLKLPHDAVADLLLGCACKHGGGGSKGRVQWDPARDLMSSDGRGHSAEPRKMLRERAIQVGLSRSLSAHFVASTTSIEDVTMLAWRVGEAHRERDVPTAMRALAAEASLPYERPYTPRLPPEELERLGIRPMDAAVEASVEEHEGYLPHVDDGADTETYDGADSSGAPEENGGAGHVEHVAYACKQVAATGHRPPRGRAALECVPSLALNQGPDRNNVVQG